MHVVVNSGRVRTIALDVGLRGVRLNEVFPVLQRLKPARVYAVVRVVLLAQVDLSGQLTCRVSASSPLVERAFATDSQS